MKCVLERYSFRFERCYPQCSGSVNLWKAMTNQRGICGGNGDNGGNGNNPMKPPQAGVEWGVLERPELLDKMHGKLNIVRLRYGWSYYPQDPHRYHSVPWINRNTHNEEYYTMLKAYVNKARMNGIWVIINMFKTQSGFMFPGQPPWDYEDGAWQQLYDPSNHDLLKSRCHKVVQTIGANSDNTILELFCEPFAREWCNHNANLIKDAHYVTRSVLKHECGWGADKISTNGWMDWCEPGEYYSYHWGPAQNFQSLADKVKARGCKPVFSTDGKEIYNIGTLLNDRDTAIRVGGSFMWWNPHWGHENNWHDDIVQALGR